MTFGAEIWGPILASAASGYLNNQGKQKPPEETKIQKSQGQLIDQMLASINGNGPFQDLFNANDDIFNRSFVEPAKHRFQNQIAPQIQQSYIANGQQGGTALEDALTRAGVDLNSQLDQQYYNFQNDALNRKQGAINGILGYGPGYQNQNPTSAGQDIMSSLGGYVASPGFSDTFSNLFKNNQGSMNQNANAFTRGGQGIIPPRKGYSA